MFMILLTGAGIGIGSFFLWVVERRPDLLSSSVSIDMADIERPNPTVFIVAIMCIALIFYALSTASISMGEGSSLAFLFSIISGIALFDFRYQLIPNSLVIVGILGWLFFAALNVIPLIGSLIAGVSVGLILLMVRFLGYLLYGSPGMGIGDIKLGFLMGVFLQWDVFWALYLAIFIGALWAVAGIIFNRVGKQNKLPFAPFLWVGASISAFVFPFQSFLSLWL